MSDSVSDSIEEVPTASAAPRKPKKKRAAKKKNDFFTVKRQYIKNEATGKREHVRTDLRFEESPLTNHLRDITEDDEFYSDEPYINSRTLLPNLNIFRQSIAHVVGMAELVKFLEKEFKHEVDIIDTMIETGIVSYDGLSFLYKKGDKVYTIDNDEIVAGEILKVRYLNSYFFSAFEITINVITSDGTSFIADTEKVNIMSYDKPKKLEELDVCPMTDKMLDKLTERGRLYQKIALGSNYQHYDGNLYYREWWKVHIFKAQGRVMVDNYNFARVNPEYNRYSRNERQVTFKMIPENKLYMAKPWVFGFSFLAKKWGEIAVSKISDVKFDDKAFDQLVLDKDRKHLIRSLVEHSHESFSDIITGKGGGCIFLLHGAPGTGKTLTAESIAELLHRPLYSVSVGELGVHPDDLEERLRQILDMAMAWDAVILIDEADIFLEQRTEDDLERNAMVAIFLRLLEYHQGVLFLTTNRVKVFDAAFFSRISVCLNYQDLDTDDRIQVWTNLLQAAKVPFNSTEIGKLADFELNGRQIKNVIRLSESLAKSDDISVTLKHFVNTINITGQFQKQHDLA